MRDDKNQQWVGAVYAEDLDLMREMLDEDAGLANSMHAEFDDPYRSDRYPVSTLMFAVAGPPPQQLDWRAVEREINFGVIKLLVESGADTNIECGHGLPLCVVRDEAVAQYLVEHGADISRWTDNGGSPLFFSVWNYDPDRLRMQLKLGADPYQCDPRTGQSALHAAALMAPETSQQHTGLLEVVRLFLEAGVDPNGRTKANVESFALECGPPLHGDTPLHLAAGFGTSEIVRLLVESSADKTMTNNLGKTPFDCAAARNRAHGVLELLK